MAGAMAIALPLAMQIVDDCSVVPTRFYWFTVHIISYLTLITFHWTQFFNTHLYLEPISKI